MSTPITKCPKCGRITPTRHNECVYCAADLSATRYEEPRMLGKGSAAKPRFQRKSDDRTHYLIAPSRGPIEMQEGKLFVMGRDPRASLVIHLRDVSRQHAEIDWDGNDPPLPMLKEIRASNGTFLNGKPVLRGRSEPMRSGDTIRLGAAFTVKYLFLTERGLKLEQENSGDEDTREIDVGAVGRPRADTKELGNLVAAALGEEDLVPLETHGDFTKLPAHAMVKRLYSEQRSGILTVFDGTEVGEVVLIDGRCKHAIFGVRGGRDVLAHVARMEAGFYRFREVDPDLLDLDPPPSEVDEQGIALSGDFEQMPGSELVRDLIRRRVTGVLTVFDGKVTGAMGFHGGICQHSTLGVQRERAALDEIVRIRRGQYRFRPQDSAAHAEFEGQVRWADSPIDHDQVAHTQRYTGAYPPAPPAAGPPSGNYRVPLRSPDSEEGVLRRSHTPVRAPKTPSPLGQPTGRMTRRQRPPLPKRRNPPPPKPR